MRSLSSPIEDYFEVPRALVEKVLSKWTAVEWGAARDEILRNLDQHPIRILIPEKIGRKSSLRHVQFFQRFSEHGECAHMNEAMGHLCYCGSQPVLSHARVDKTVTGAGVLHFESSNS